METKINFTWKDGKPYYDGNLTLYNTAITSLPDNLVVKGWLWLEGCKSLASLPDNLVVGCFLDLRDTAITSLPDNLVVSGSLHLQGIALTSLPDNLVVGGSLDLEGCKSLSSLPNNLVVGGSLYLSDTAITSLPDNLVVKGWLNLEDCKSLTSLPDKLVVGGGLDLRDTAITSLPDSLIVGGYIYTNNEVGWRRAITPEQQARLDNALNKPLIWESNGQKYISIDDIFSVVDNHHGNVYHTHKIGCNDTIYIVTDGEGHWAHGDSLAEAKTDLIYKISDRDTSKYKSMTLDDTLSFGEAIVAYRSITGACSLGTRDYIENRLPQPRKDKYTIREIIELTEGEYGGKKFKEFFSMNK